VLENPAIVLSSQTIISLNPSNSNKKAFAPFL